MELNEFINTIKDILVFDTETEGKNPHTAKLVGVGFASNPTTAIWLEDREAIQRLLSLPLPKLGHSIKFDYITLKNNGYQVGGDLDDTYIMSRVYGRFEKYGLKEIHNKLFGTNYIGFKEMLGKYNANLKKDLHTIHNIPKEILVEYCKNDCRATFKLYEYLGKEMDLKDRWVYEHLERPLIRVVAEMERKGIKIDREQVSLLDERTAKSLQEMRGMIWEYVGECFNVNSTQVLGKIFETLGYPTIKLTKKTKRMCVDEEVLKVLTNRKFTLARMIKTYRTLYTNKTRYTGRFNWYADTNSRIHTDYDQVGTDTGRWSSQSPNMQQIPKKFRPVFVGNFTEFDYKQMEIAITAHLTKDKAFTESIMAGIDAHKVTASNLGIPRDTAKTINFGVIYGQSKFGLSKELGCSTGEASEYLEAFFKVHPEIKQFGEAQMELLEQKGYVETLLGRKRYFDTETNYLDEVKRQAMNSPIQGSGADIIKLAMVEMAKENLIPTLQVHDSLLFEDLPEDKVDRVKEIMEGVAKLAIPLRVDVKRSIRWGEEIKN